MKKKIYSKILITLLVFLICSLPIMKLVVKTLQVFNATVENNESNNETQTLGNRETIDFNSDWLFYYSGSEELQDISVNLIVTDEVHVTEYGTVVTTPNLESEIDSGKVNVNISTEFENETNETKTDMTIISTYV